MWSDMKERSSMQLCDLHAHTTASDGSYTPSELVRYAREKGLAALAVTDHDTVDGLPEAEDQAGRVGLRLIPGVELSTRLEGRDIHIVGLFVRWRDPDFQSRIRAMGATRDQRNYDMVQKLADNGFDIRPEDLDRFRGRVVTKANIGAILMERGYGEVKEVVEKYLVRGRIGYVARKMPAPEECIDTIHRAGGLAFVAHTNQIDRSDRDHSVSLCCQVLDMGADGLETLYCEFDDDWRARTEAIAREYGCLRSGGSDFHGKYKKGLDLMTGYSGLAVPVSLLEPMEARLGLTHM